MKTGPGSIAVVMLWVAAMVPPPAIMAAGLVVAGSGCRDGRHSGPASQPGGADVVPPESAPASAQESPAATEATDADRARDGRPDDLGARPGALVDIADIDRSIALDIRYATADNFAGVAVYPVARCLLRREVAERLARVQAALSGRGLSLLLWDCYRPFSVQERFWQLVPDPRYVARPERASGVPVKGSKHNRGAAVDVTLVDRDGNRLEMPTEYDDFTRRAHRDYRGATPTARRNAEVLEAAMVAEGFRPMVSEWWHFDGPGWRRYPLEDVPLSGPGQ